MTLSTVTGARDALDLIDDAITAITIAAATSVAAQNRLYSTIDALARAQKTSALQTLESPTLTSLRSRPSSRVRRC
jgi:flagellin-like hook-associated protein FlgL